MITSFETGAAFVLKDQFSEPLRKLFGGLSEADAAIKKLIDSGKAFGLGFDKDIAAATKSLLVFKNDVVEKAGLMGGALDKSFQGWSKSAELAGDSVMRTLARVDASIKATNDALASTMTKIDMAAAGTRLPGSGGFGRIGHGFGDIGEAKAVFRGGSKGFEAASMLLPFEVTPLTAGLAVGAAGVYEAIQQQHAAAKALMGGNLDAMSFGLTRDSMVDMIKKGASKTGDSFDAVAGAYTAGSRILQGVDATTRLNLVKGLLGPAEYEAQMKGTSLEEAVKSMLELAHQTGTYAPSAIQKMASQFSVASLNSNAGLETLTNQSSYFMPQLHAALGLDFGSGISLEVAAMNAGLLRAGTSIKNFGQNIFAKSGKGGQEHNDALRALGLLSADDKPLWQVLGKDGQTDWTASELQIGEMIEKSLSGMDDTGRMDRLHHAFGEQGGRIAALLSTKAFREQVTGIKGRVDEFGSGDLLGQLKAIDPMQQWRETWTDLKNVLGDIGTIVLPPLNLALRGLDEVLKGIHAGLSWIPDHFKAGGGALPTSPNDPRSMPGLPGLGGAYGGSPASPMAYMAGESALTPAVRDGFLQAFSMLKGIDMGGVGGSGGLTNAAYFGTGSTGSASGGGTFASPGGSTGSVADIAGRFLGANEVRDRGLLNSFMGQYGSHIDAVRTAWCAAFVNSSLAAVGIKGTGSLAASSFNRWGIGVDLPHAARGDIIAEGHHVGIFTGEIDKLGRLGMISGNYSNSVSHSWADPRHILGLRRSAPTVGAPPRRPTEVHQHQLTVMLDGKQITAHVTRQQSNRGRFPTSVGALDAHGSFASPGTPFIDAA